MKRKAWLLFTVCLISGTALFFSRSILNACGWGGDYDESYYSFFDSRLAGSTKYYPFFFTVNQYYNEEKLNLEVSDLQGEVKVISNASAWKQYFGGQATEAEASRLVYDSSPEDLEKLIQLCAVPLSAIPAEYKKNGAINSVIEKKNTAAIEYLLFAKRCEPLVSYPEGWEGWEPPARDTLSMRKMIGVGNSAIASAKETFLKRRYAFQVMRLAMYAGFPGEALDIYDRELGNGNPSDIISVWALSLKGGALKRKKNFNEARYVFSRLFDEYFSFNGLSYRENFDMSTPFDGSANSTLTFCKTDHEKAVVWALDALTYEVSTFTALKEIFKLDPSSSLTNLVLTRQMKELEHSVPGSKRGKWSDENGQSEVREMRDFLSDCIRKGGMSNPSLWEFSFAYVSLLARDFETAEQYFSFARQHSPANSLLSDHIAMLLALKSVWISQPGDPDFESIVLKQLDWMEKNSAKKNVGDATSFLYRILADKFSETDLTGVRTTLCLAHTEMKVDLKANPDRELCRNLITFLESTNRTALEKKLISGFNFSLQGLHDIIGTTFMAERDFENALAEFSLAGDIGNLPADPFEVHIRDCHDCDFESPKEHIWSKADFAKAMIDLKKRAVVKGPEQADVCFSLASGYYNMTYFGNSWMLTEYYRDCCKMETWGSKKKIDSMTDWDLCRECLDAYSRAMETSKDIEFKAKCAYMAAKCEQNAYYLSEDYRFEEKDNRKENYRGFFRTMKKDYSNTDYYKEVIEECGYFRYWLTK